MVSKRGSNGNKGVTKGRYLFVEPVLIFALTNIWRLL